MTFYLEGHWQKYQDPEQDPESDPDPNLESDPHPESDPNPELDPNPHMLGTGTDPQIRIRNNMSRIPNTA
jgi:hypothetical protein